MILIFALIAFGALAGCLWALFWPRPYQIRRDDHDVDLWDRLR